MLYGLCDGARHKSDPRISTPLTVSASGREKMSTKRSAIPFLALLATVVFIGGAPAPAYCADAPPTPTNDTRSRGKQSGAVRSEVGRLVTGSPEHLQSVVAGTPPTAILAVNPVNPPSGVPAYPAGVTIVGNELRAESGGFRAWFHVQVSNWDPLGNGPNLATYQVEIACSGYLDSDFAGDQPDLLPAGWTDLDVRGGIACPGFDPTPCVTAFGEAWAICTGGLCDAGYVDHAADRPDSWCAPSGGGCNSAGVDISDCSFNYYGVSNLLPGHPDQPSTCVGGTRPGQGCTTGAQCTGGGTCTGPGLATYYGGTLVLDIPPGAKGKYTVLLNPNETFVASPGIPPVVIDSLEETGFVVNILTGSCCYAQGTPGAGCTDGLLRSECDALAAPREFRTDWTCSDGCADCNDNGIPDSVDIAMATSLDCDWDGGEPNGIPDECDIVECIGNPGCGDCNFNGVPDRCDIVSTTSEDVLPPPSGDGIPDECAEYIDGCDPNPNWSCPANWDLPGDVYPDDENSAPGVYVTLDGSDSVFLDVDATIPAMQILSGATLYVAQSGTGDLTVNSDSGILIEGNLLSANDRSIDVPLGTVTIAPGGLYGEDPNGDGSGCIPPEAGNACSSLSAAQIEIEGAPCDANGGEIILVDQMTLTGTGPLILDGSASLCLPYCAAVAGNVAGVTPPPKLRLSTRSSVILAGSVIAGPATAPALVMIGAVNVFIDSTVPVLLGGDFDNRSVVPHLFDWTAGKLTLDGTAAQTFEVAGINLGQTTEGYLTDADALFDSCLHPNYSMGTVEVALGASVTFANRFTNTAGGGCDEALYVHELIFRAGSTVTIDHCKVYYGTLLNEGVTPTLLGCAELMTDVPPPPVIVWNSDPLSPERTTRSLRFRVEPPVSPTATLGQSAIKVTMVDLQHPNPPNLLAQAPPNLTTYDTRLNGVCVGGSLAGHHCDMDADCAAPGTCTGGLAACTADPACTNASACTLPSNGCARWVGKLGTFYESQGPPVSGPYSAARLQCTPYYWDWKPEGLISVVGADVAPSSEFSVQVYGASCMGAEAGCANVSPAVTMYTRRSGDVEQPYNPPSATGQPDVTDVSQLVNKFKNVAGAPVKAISQIQPNLPELNANINVLDILAVVDALKGVKYAFSGPCACPSLVTCELTACTSDTPCINAYGAGSKCMKTCTGPGPLTGDLCIDNTHCVGSGTCGTGFCRDRCGRCSP